MNRKTTTAALIAIGLALAGCSDDAASPDDGPDAGPDIIVDTATDSDLGPDTPTVDTGDTSGEADASDASDLAIDEPDAGPQGLPQALPFKFTRPAAGTPPTEEEIATFTRAVTGFWRDSDYFRWVRMTSHGVDSSNSEGWPSYALWWQDTQASRVDDAIVFTHFGRADNLTLRTCKVLTNAIAGYLLTGDDDMRWIVEQYSQGLAALSMAMEFEEDDPHRYLQARAIFTRNHEYDTVGGRHVVIDYDPVRRDEEAWNAAIIHNPTNPYWGDIWFVNQRSKDDVPHMYRAVPMLMRAAEEAPDASVREAAELALEYISGFARDIVDTEYQIRTRFDGGEPVVPTTEDGAVKDLATFTLFDGITPLGECNAKLSSALLGYGETLEHDCEDGVDELFEGVAATTHYFNYAIFRTFHIAAVHNALMFHENDLALAMLRGLADRFDRMLHDETMPNRDEPVWDADVAVYLLAAASAGLPLTGEEARFVQEQVLSSVVHYGDFEAWDPWEPDFPQGDFDYKPDRGVAVRPTELGYLLEYCYSPLRNPAGAEVVDCEVVGDMDRWGE